MARYFTTLTIAGVQLNISCDQHIRNHELGEVYNPFIGKEENDPLLPPVQIYLKPASFPAADNMTQVFETGQKWSLFLDDEGNRVVVSPSAAFGQPRWIAFFDNNTSEIDVYVGGDLVQEENGQKIVVSPLHYPLDQLLIMYILSSREGVLLHSSGIRIHDKGFLFAGRSTAGKTTLSRQLATLEHIEILSDDRIVVRRIKEDIRAFGTPWPGEGKYALNTSFPLSGIFFLNKSQDNRIEKITPQQALERLLPVASIPWFDPEPMTQILDFCERIVTTIPVFDLHFRPDIEVVKMLEDFALK